jgi:hypothetical protein
VRPVEDDWPEFWEQVNHAVLRAGSSLDTYRSDEHPHVVRVFSLDWDLLEPLIDEMSEHPPPDQRPWDCRPPGEAATPPDKRHLAPSAASVALLIDR